MSVRGQLRNMLATVATALGADLRGHLVFVGGVTTALFITDSVTLEDVRATDDVDIIVDVAGYPEWAELQAQLRDRGFVEAQDDGVICRMRLANLKVDFMPDDPKILGFSNRWYAKGIETSEICSLTDTLDIRLLRPDLFVATKLEAYLGRGNGDYITSRDLEDVLLLFDGRPEIVEEVLSADQDVRSFIAEQLANFLRDPEFDDFLEGNIRGPEGRVDIVRKRLRAVIFDLAG